jgi:signal transduction histidine kinase
MFSLVFLILAIILQFVGAIVAISLTKRTKYNLSWIFLSFGFLTIAIQRVLEFLPHVWKDFQKNVDRINIVLDITSAVLFTAGIILIQQIFIYLRKVEKARLETEKKVLNAIIKTEETERRRFAKDLHDGLGPLLSTVKMAISTLAQLENNPKSKDIIQNTDVVITEAIKNVKEISNILSPHILDNFGLVSAINSFISKINLAKNIDISFKTNMSNERYDYNTEVVLYRVACELINNTLKHAKAQKIDMELARNEDLLSMMYTDDGVGFDVNEVLSEQNPGMGYANIMSRIKSIKGIINIESEKEKGTKVIIVVNTKNA